MDTFFETIRARQASQEGTQSRSSKVKIHTPRSEEKKKKFKPQITGDQTFPRTRNLVDPQLEQIDEDGPTNFFRYMRPQEPLFSSSNPSRSTSLHPDLSLFVPNPLLFER